MINQHELHVDLLQRGCDPIIQLTQGDVDSHEILFWIKKNRRRWRPPAGLSVLVHYSNSFHSGGTYDTLSDGSPAWKLGRDCLRVALVPEMMALPGSVHVVVTLLHGDTALSAFHVQLMVQGLATATSPVLTNYTNITGFLPKPDTAEEGQFFAAKTVSEAGIVTSVTAVDAPSGGGIDSSLLPTAAVTRSDGSATITLTDKNGTTTATVFDGKDGKSAFESALEGGYTGTEEEFAAKLAQEYPTTLPNPNALTINGQSYDGSGAVESDTRFFEVTITDNGDGTYTSSHYYSDIAVAYKRGRIPIAKMGVNLFSLVYFPNTNIMEVVKFNRQEGAVLTTITIRRADVLVSVVTMATPEDIPDISQNPFYLILDTVVNDDGSVPVLGWLDGERAEEGTDLTACYNAYLQGRAVFVRAMVEDPEASPLMGLILSCTYCDGNMAVFGLSEWGTTLDVTVMDGVATVSICEPPRELPNPNALTINGTSYDGSTAVDMTQSIQNMINQQIPSIPEALKNPHKLTFTGAVCGEYDGSETVSIEIPTVGDAETETVLSDNLLDLSLLTKGKAIYYGSSGYQLVDSTYSHYGFIPLRGSGTYRTKFQQSVHSSTGTRIALVNDDHVFVANVTGTCGEVTEDVNWVDFTFAVTEANIAAGATKVVFDVYEIFMNQTMLVKDREYPSEYIPFGYIEVATDSGKKQNNVLCEKTAVFLGDSICAGTTVGTDSPYYGYGWAGLIGDANRMNWTNYGKNGGTITHRGADGTCISTIADTAISEHPAADYIIFEGGCNDSDQMREAGLGVISGDYATFDTTTFSGALEALILKLVTAYPYAKIGYIIPQKMYTGYADYTAENHIHRLYFDRAVEICRKWGIPVMDLWNENPLNPKLPTASLFYVEENGQHLTLAGYQRITHQVEALRRNL